MWSGTLLELLNMISRKYIVYYEDYLTFARVCKSWHSAAALGDYSNGPPSQFPSLLLAEKEDDGWEFREFFLLSNKSIRKIRLPEAYGKVCRSSCGWIVTVGHDHAAQLINPLSRETINLLEDIYTTLTVDILEPVSHFLEAARENLSLKICRCLKITKLPTFNLPHCRGNTCSLAATEDSFPASLAITEGEAIYDYCWYPYMFASSAFLISVTSLSNVLIILSYKSEGNQNLSTLIVS
ncbi:hypothetical protein Tco_0934726 [Tanacetum coccineum]